MKLDLNKQYLTRNGLTISLVNYDSDPRQIYPFTGQYDNGPRQGDKDFWTEDGVFVIHNENENDLMSELD